MSDKSNSAVNLIYVTGFGLFGGHTEVNASWQAVRLLPSEWTLPDGRQCQLKLLEIPVTYCDVDEAVQEIWKEDPKLVIHCGVHGEIDVVHLEKHSWNSQYTKKDVSGMCLQCPIVPVSLKDSLASAQKCTDQVALCTSFNVDGLVEKLNVDLPDVKCKASVEVGNFLCGYIYLKSLDQNANRTLFVHVPEVNRPYSSEDVKRLLLRTIELCMEQLGEGANGEKC